MAEGWARQILGDRVEAHSAGTEPSEVNPRALQVMGEAGVDISSHRSESVEEFSDQPFDLVITLCDEARANCPIFLGATKTIHKGFPKPAEAVGSDEEVLEVFREVRDRIQKELIPLVEEELAKLGEATDH